MFENFCTPALIFIVFSIVQIVIDLTKGMFNTAFIKVWTSLILAVLLNMLCKSGMSMVAWIFVFVPFLLMSVIIAFLLTFFGLDPASGKLVIRRPASEDNMIMTPDPRQEEDRFRKFLKGLSQEEIEKVLKSSPNSKEYETPNTDINTNVNGTNNIVLSSDSVGEQHAPIQDHQLSNTGAGSNNILDNNIETFSSILSQYAYFN